MRDRALAPGEWAVLALLCEKPAHGWALARELSAGGEVGSIWSLGRPLVYRSLDILHDRDLIAPVGSEPGARGPSRTIFAATKGGIAAVASWLEEPVEHVREGRSLLLLKIVIAERSSIDPDPLLVAQHAAITASLAGLEERGVETDGAEGILVRFRIESNRAVLRFLEGLLEGAGPAG